MSKTGRTYYERQRQPLWAYLLLAGVNLLFLYGMVQQTVLGQPWGNNPMSNAGLITTVALLLPVSALTLCARLDTVIDQDGIHVRYNPFKHRFKLYAWSDIRHAEVRARRMAEYGGTGIRYGRHGKAYVASGKYGVQIELHNGKKVFISTRRPDEINEHLTTYGKRKQK